MTILIALHLTLLHQFIRVIFDIQLYSTNFYLYNLFIIILLIFSKNLITLLLGNCYKEIKSSGASAFHLVFIKTIISLIVIFFLSFLSRFHIASAIDISQYIYIIIASAINFILLDEIVMGIEGPLFMSPKGPDSPDQNPPLGSQGSTSKQTEFKKPKRPIPITKIKKNKVPPVDHENVPSPNYFPAFSPKERVKNLAKLENQVIEKYEQANRAYKQSPTPQNAQNLESSTTVLDYYSNRREKLKDRYHVDSSSEDDSD
jgi:hypothetical protein